MHCSAGKQYFSWLLLLPSDKHRKQGACLEAFCWWQLGEACAHHIGAPARHCCAAPPGC